MATVSKEFEPNIFGRLVSINRENNGKKIVITIERNTGMSDFITKKLETMFANKNVCIEFTPLLQYLKFRKMLDEEDKEVADDKQTTL